MEPGPARPSCWPWPRGHGFHSVIARIAGHNETSIGLHRAAGFELVGVERVVGRKHRQWMDVVELQRLL